MKNNKHALLAVLFLLVGALSASVIADELSPAAQRGESGFVVCNACHNPELDPPLGPPMWGLQRRYGMASKGDKDQFVQRMVDFVRTPDKSKAIMIQAVDQLGLMPGLDLPINQLTDIATYIYEATFPPPCPHWRIAIKRAEAQGGAALEHAAKDKMMLKRFCSS